MLCLNGKDILKAATEDEVLSAVEKALRIYEDKTFKMPDRTQTDYGGTTLLLMPCFTAQAFGTKLVTVTPENGPKNLPVVDGLMILNEGMTSRPLAVMNGSVLTALRTGAVGGVAVRQLAPADSRHLGIVGLGVQGLSQALFASHVRPITDLYLFDALHDKVQSFSDKFRQARPQIKIHAVDSPAELLQKSQIVILATTSNQPVLPDQAEMLKNRCFVAIGSYKPDMRELPDALFPLCDQVFIDTEFAAEESGDLVVPLKKNLIRKDQVFTLGKHLKGDSRVKKGGQGTRLFKSVGMALFDVVVAHLLYEKAKQKGLGTEVEL